MHFVSWGMCGAFLGISLCFFRCESVKLGAFCRAWMPGHDVNSVQGGEADQSGPTTVLRSKEERQNIQV